MSLLLFSTKFVWSISHSKKKCAIYDQKYFGLHVKVHVIRVRFQLTRIFSTRVSKNTQTSNFMKIPPVWSVLFHVKGWTEGTDWRTEAKSRFRNFSNASINCACYNEEDKKIQSGELPREYKMLERRKLVQTWSCEKYMCPSTVHSCGIQYIYCFYTGIFVLILEQSRYWTWRNTAVIQEYTRISIVTANSSETHSIK
jgi:hypothetical protein